MIITLNMDTEKDKEVCKKVLSLVLDFGGSVEGAPRAVKNVYEAARRLSAGEQVIYKAEPKKRGRKPKHPKE